jgi:alanyl-tRNA synthetase
MEVAADTSEHVRRARADFAALSKIARTFSGPLDDVAALVDAQREKLQEADRVRRRLATELAQMRGRALYAETSPSHDGVRRVLRRLDSLSDDVRTESQAFTTAGPRAVFVALGADPPSVLLAVSSDSGVHAGDLLKRTLTATGGRGGGSATAAQGSLPAQSLDDLACALLRELKFPAQVSSARQSS